MTKKKKKTKQTHRYREQTSGYQWEEGREEGQDRDRQVGEWEVQTVLYKISYKDMLQNMEYTQYFIITINGVQQGVQPLKMLKYCTSTIL